MFSGSIMIAMVSMINTEPTDSTDYRIASYILEHLDQLGNCSINQLASDCYVSPASISRFCRKSGLEDFSQLRSNLDQCIAVSQKEIDISGMFQGNMKNSYIDEIIKNLLILKQSILDEKIETLAKDLFQYKNVYAFGYLHSENIALNFQYNLIGFRKVINTYIRYREQIEVLKKADENDLIIIFSKSGNYFYQAFHNKLPFRKQHKPKIYMVTNEKAMEEFELIDEVIYYDVSSVLASHPYSLEVIENLICIAYGRMTQEMNKKIK